MIIVAYFPSLGSGSEVGELPPEERLKFDGGGIFSMLDDCGGKGNQPSFQNVYRNNLSIDL